MIAVTDLTKSFGRFRALDQVSLNVQKGNVYGLVGPNGAGKSTLIRHLTGVYRPDSGSVTIDGVPVWDITERFCWSGACRSFRTASAKFRFSLATLRPWSCPG